MAGEGSAAAGPNCFGIGDRAGHGCAFVPEPMPSPGVRAVVPRPPELPKLLNVDPCESVGGCRTEHSWRITPDIR